MNIEAELIRKISKRISALYEDKAAIISAELNGKKMISENVVNVLKNGKLFNKKNTYLTKGQIERLENIFEIPRRKLLFGNDGEIKELVEELYYKVAYNFNIEKRNVWNRHIFFEEKIVDISREYHELTFFSARLAFLWSLTEMEESKKKAYSPQFDFDESHRQQYDMIVNFIWSNNNKTFIDSFREEIVYQDDITFKDLEALIIYWLRKSFIRIIRQLKESCFMSDIIFNIGYQVREILCIAKNEVSQKIKEIEKKKEIPEGLYEDLYNKWYPIKPETTQSYILMHEPDVDTPVIISNDEELENFEVLLNIEKVYIDHAINLMRVQDALIDLKGNNQIDFLVIPRVIRGK
ncbi:hypothetical protein [Sporosarcina sp. FSL K6-3508]|uniref:hypothetical protein n=1 Tax=Sporosarcina sp. FSL K6-3508 TaxID=2921557 RepID=UPI00315AF6B0